jgi:hypothetical protein
MMKRPLSYLTHRTYPTHLTDPTYLTDPTSQTHRVLHPETPARHIAPALPGPLLLPGLKIIDSQPITPGRSDRFTVFLCEIRRGRDLHA